VRTLVPSAHGPECTGPGTAQQGPASTPADSLTALPQSG
jgi:hypothetical protein